MSKGLFDVSDLEKELKELHKIGQTENGRAKNSRIILQIKERQRIKAEVEKVLDEWFQENSDWDEDEKDNLLEVYGKDFEDWKKKRLGIK